MRNTHENFLAAAAKLGLGLRDIPPCVTFFAPVSVDAERPLRLECGAQASGRFRRPARRDESRARRCRTARIRSIRRARAASAVTLIRHRAPRRGGRSVPDDLAGNRRAPSSSPTGSLPEEEAMHHPDPDRRRVYAHDVPAERPWSRIMQARADAAHHRQRRPAGRRCPALLRRQIRRSATARRTRCAPRARPMSGSARGSFPTRAG